MKSFFDARANYGPVSKTLAHLRETRDKNMCISTTITLQKVFLNLKELTQESFQITNISVRNNISY